MEGTLSESPNKMLLTSGQQTFRLGTVETEREEREREEREGGREGEAWEYREK